MLSFDTFQGLPLRWDPGFGEKYAPAEGGYPEGMFDDKGKPPYMDPRIAWQVGFFNETLPSLVQTWASDSRIALMHIDCDLYESAADAFKNVHKFLRTNSFIVFDELVNYPAYKDGEMKALWEWFHGGDRCIEVLGTPGPVVIEASTWIDTPYSAITMPGDQNAAFRVCEMSATVQ